MNAFAKISRYLSFSSSFFDIYMVCLSRKIGSEKVCPSTLSNNTDPAVLVSSSCCSNHFIRSSVYAPEYNFIFASQCASRDVESRHFDDKTA